MHSCAFAYLQLHLLISCSRFWGPHYLRDFIRNHSTIVKPLHDLIANYDRTRKKVWTPETTAAYKEMKLQVSKCTTMHFSSDTAPITLHTDASDYGVGGYLFQTVDSIDQPVAFVSKFLNKSQLCWSVIQKESYGIFYSCTYLQSLLRDRLFSKFKKVFFFIFKNGFEKSPKVPQY